MSDTSHIPPSDPWEPASEVDGRSDAETESGSERADREYGRAWPERDWEALADYLGEEGSAELRAATAHRLQTDAAFARFAAPLLALWALALPVPSADVDVVDVEAAWAALERRAAAAQATQSAIPPAVEPARRGRDRGVSRRWSWPRLTVHPAWALALLLLLIVGSTSLYVAQRPRDRALRYYTATPATAHTLTLADGSTVTLTPGSTLVTDGLVPSPHPERSRLVHLDGTGRFVVHADPAHPFIVETHGISAVAVGTTFQVAAHQIGGGNASAPMSPSSNPASPTGAVFVRVTSGKVMVQRQDLAGHRHTLAVLGPGQETSVQTFTRYFKAGWAAAAAHKSVADAYLEYQSMKAADSARAAMAR